MRRLLMGAAMLALAAAGAASSQTLKTDEVWSSVLVKAINPPDPVRGADGRTHLAYELLMVNTGDQFVRLDKVEAVGPGGETLGALEGDALTNMTHVYGGGERTLSPGASELVLMDVSFPASARLPDRIATRVTASRRGDAKPGEPAALPSNPLKPNFTFTTAPMAVGKPAIVLEPPLRGKNWFDANGCCDSNNMHRTTIIPVNGRPHVPQRFAVDWMQLSADDRIVTGDPTKFENHPGYGAPIYAAGDGVVVNLYDDTPDQVPFQTVTGITTEGIGGDMVVIDMGGGAFAFYGHLQRGKLKVKLGDHVKTGQVIGLLGNTGNSTAPHLHFQVMDGPSPLNADSVPYVFTHFSGRGFLAEDEAAGQAVMRGEPARIEPRFTGEHVNELPLNGEIVDFP
jgi:hypothetical protein